MSDPNARPEASSILRPVGALERFSAVRHNLGYYRCVASTAKYRTETNPQLLGSIIETAIAKTILKHPALCCGIINEDQIDPTFIRLESINLSSCIKYRNPDLDLSENEGICQVLEYQHRQLFPNLDSQPAWRVIIIPTRKLSNTKGAAFDLLFAFHHAIGDGISGLVFHRTILEALNDPSPCQDLFNHILKTPASIKLAPPVEQKLNFRISWIFFLKAIWDEFRPKWLFPESSPPWTGAPCSAETIEKYESRVKLIVIPPNLVATILTACRTQKATITGLFHGLVQVSLVAHIPTATSFSCATPYSLRHLTELSATDEMGTHISGMSVKCSSDVISRIRASRDPVQLTNEVWGIARSFRKDMATELARLPNDNPIGMLPYVSDIHSMFKGRVGKPRSETYEISNVGVLPNSKPDAGWKVERAIFSQSGNGTGPAVNFSVATVEGGPLTISVTWLEGDMDLELMELVTNDLDYALRCLGEGKDVTVGL